MASRQTVSTFSQHDDSNKQKITFSSGIPPTTHNVVEITPATKSLYLTVATGSAFPYVAQWFHDKSNEMQLTAEGIEAECDGSLQSDLRKHHKAILHTRAQNEKERQKLLAVLQQLQAARRHQRSFIATWRDTFQSAANAYMAALNEMEATLLHRVRLAEDWTLRGERDKVVATLTRLRELRETLQRRAERDIAWETTRRDVTLQRMRSAMASLVGRVGDAVTWAVQRRLLGHTPAVSGRLRSRRPMDAAAAGVLNGNEEGVEEEEEVQLLREEQALQKELQGLTRRRMVERGRRRRWQIVGRGGAERKEGGDGEEGGLPTCEMGSGSVPSHPIPSTTTLTTTTTTGTTNTATADVGMHDAIEVGKEETNSVVLPPLSSSTSGGKDKKSTELDASSLLEDKSHSKGHAPIQRRSVPGVLKLPTFGRKEEQRQDTPPRRSPLKPIRSSTGGTNNEKRDMNTNDDGNNNNNNNNGRRNNEKKEDMIKKSRDSSVSHATVASLAAAPKRTAMYRRNPIISRPPIVLPPNDTSRSIHGRSNPDHIAILLAALTEDTSHFAVSKEKTHEEVETLREELRKQREETERLLQTNISLETQRAQLLVQRDAQVVKLASTAKEQSTQAKIRAVDDQVQNEELQQMLEVVLEQHAQRQSEITQVCATIADLRKSIEKQEKMLLLVREYWRSNAIAMKQLRNVDGGRMSCASVSFDRTLTSMPDLPSTTLWRQFNTTATPAALLAEAASVSPTPPPTGKTSAGSGRRNLYQSIPVLRLTEPDEVARFLYSLFEDLGVGPTEGLSEEL